MIEKLRNERLCENEREAKRIVLSEPDRED
jgi:hypothetical protein